MGKHKERNKDFEFDDDVPQALFGDIDLEDDAFFDQFQPKKARQRGRRDRNARRRIEEYREEQDPVREFFEDICLIDPKAYCPVTDLRAAYDEWAKENGDHYTLCRREFNKRVRGRGCDTRSKRLCVRIISGKLTENLLKFLPIFIFGLKSQICMTHVAVRVSNARK